MRGLIKEQMNEADWALIGVTDVYLRREYADLQKSKSEVATDTMGVTKYCSGRQISFVVYYLTVINQLLLRMTN